MPLEFIRQTYKKFGLYVCMQKKGTGYDVSEYNLTTDGIRHHKYFKNYDDAVEYFDSYKNLELLSEEQMISEMNKYIKSIGICREYMRFLEMMLNRDDPARPRHMDVFYYKTDRRHTMRLYQISTKYALKTI